MKKGISPVIAAVLLVIIAVAAGVLIWTWLAGFVQRAPTSQPALNERIKIDSVGVSGNTVTIYVRNIGDVDVTISSAYVIDAVNGTTICSNINASVPIPVGGVQPVNVTCTAPLTSGHPYIAKAVTTRGTEATYQFVP